MLAAKKLTAFELGGGFIQSAITGTFYGFREKSLFGQLLNAAIEKIENGA